MNELVQSNNRTATVSAKRKFDRCPKSYDLRYNHQLRQIGSGSEAMYFGSAFHDAREAGLVAVVDPGGVTAAGAGVRSLGGNDHKDAPKMRGMVKAYHRRWRGDQPAPMEDDVHDSGFVDWMPEVAFRYGASIGTPIVRGLVPGWDVAGMVDALMRDVHTGELWISETKTSSDNAAGYFNRLYSDLQVCLYSHDIAHVLGEPVAGVLYDVIQKPTIRQKKTESPEEYEGRILAWYAENPINLVRLRVTPDRFMVERALDEREYFMRMAEWHEATPFWPRNVAECHSSFFKNDCDYMPLCSTELVERDPIAIQGFEQKPRNAELAEGRSVSEFTAR